VGRAVFPTGTAAPRPACEVDSIDRPKTGVTGPSAVPARSVGASAVGSAGEAAFAACRAGRSRLGGSWTTRGGGGARRGGGGSAGGSGGATNRTATRCAGRDVADLGACAIAPFNAPCAIADRSAHTSRRRAYTLPFSLRRRRSRRIDLDGERDDAERLNRVEH